MSSTVALVALILICIVIVCSAALSWYWLYKKACFDDDNEVLKGEKQPLQANINSDEVPTKRLLTKSYSEKKSFPQQQQNEGNNNNNIVTITIPSDKI